METDHDWSPDTRLLGCAGSLVADMQQNQQRKYLANIIRLSTSKPLILAKPGPSQGHLSTVHHPEKTSVKPALSSLSSTEGQN